jgi:hypothetical protein
MDVDLALKIARAYKLNIKTFEFIKKANYDLLTAKIPGLRNKRELYQCYQKFGKELWAAADEYAEGSINLPDPNEGSFSTKKLPIPKANALHLVAGLPGAATIKQLADVGSLIAAWFIEDLAFYVVEDYEENKDDPENAQFQELWGIVPEVEDMHTMSGYDEAALLRKINRRLSEA